MTETKPGPLAGYRPAASPRNGMPSGGGYRRFGNPDWDPANGVHLDEEAVMPSVPAARRAPLGRPARLAAYSEAREKGLSRAEAAGAAGIARSTAARYEREYRAGGAL